MTSCDSHMTVTCFIPGCVDKFVQHLHSQKRLDVTWYAGCVQVIAGMGGRTHAVKAHFPSLPSPPFPFLLYTAVVGTLLHQNNTHVQVDVTGVLFPSTVQPRVHMIRQFILPVSMRCCNRLVLGNSYLFTGHLFGGKLFTRGCVDIFYYRHDNQTRLLYSRSSATLASFRPFCPNRL